MDYSIKIGGEAGQGIATIGDALAKVFARAGYHVFTHQDYESRIRGGHNFYQVRVSERRVMSSREKIDIVMALDSLSIKHHGPELTERGVLIYDAGTIKEQKKGPAFLDIPFRKLAEEKGGSPIMANTVATGAVLGMLGMEIGLLEGLLKSVFRKKGSEVVEANVRAARAGHAYAVERCRDCALAPARPSGRERLVLNGLEAVGLSALASGCKFYAAYPMTPSTGIFNYIAAHAEKYGVVVEQAEDEIAAINMALGASFAGVRAMTGSSGGGFALMVEGLSLAGMTETPLVIALAQRPGPATGLPTRTEQGDLLFALHAGHGEFPRAAFAPGTPEEAVFLTNRAFDLAEKYQAQSFVIIDQYLADSQWTFDSLDPKKLIYKDYRLRGERFAARKSYKRHALTTSGVSALAVPGEGPRVVVTDSDEHDEEGHIIEDGGMRKKMVEKRLKKLDAMRAEMAQPTYHGPKNPDILLVGWGSTYGVLREAVDALNAKKKKAAMFHFSNVYPLPEGNYLKALQKAKRAVCVENNATGQFAKLLGMETGIHIRENVLKYDGRPFSVDYILGALNA